MQFKPTTMQTTFYAGDNALKLMGGEPVMIARMTRIATEYANEVKLRMRNSPATGRVYGLRRARKGGKPVFGPAFRAGRKTHRASAPGEPPAPDTGALLRSVLWNIWREDDRWFAGVGSALDYALYLEFGAARGVRNRSGKITKVQWILFPRPVWGPALVALRPRFREILGTGK